MKNDFVKEKGKWSFIWGHVVEEQNSQILKPTWQMNPYGIWASEMGLLGLDH